MNIDKKDANRGLYNKFEVIRKDGSAKHESCQYFVLDCTHDPHAKAALYAYASSCEDAHPALAHDLRMLAVEVPDLPQEGNQK